MKDQAFGIVPILERNTVHHFLLIQHQAGHWGFPKGHAESKESAMETACRELEEETGIYDYKCLDQRFVEQYSFIKQGRTVNKTVTYFPAWVYSEHVICQAEEIKAYAWLRYEEALETITYPPSKQVLALVKQYLSEFSKLT
ncbi:MAG: NUDIX domain-containing protein [Elainellaceae cyanobacterium]